MATLSSGYRAIIIRAVTFLAGIYFFLEFILPKTAIEAWGIQANHEAITNGFVVVGSMAFGLGLISVVQVHGSRVAFARRGWPNSLALLIGLVTTITVTAMSWVQNLEISRETQSISTVAEFAEKLIKNETVGTPQVADFRGRVKILREAARDRLAFAESHTNNSFEEEKISIELLNANLAIAKERMAVLDAQLAESDDEALKAAVLSLAPVIREVGSADGKLQRSRQDKRIASRMYRLLLDGVFVALGSAMFSLLGLYIAAAAYRAFRIRSIESSLMMTAAVLVMLGQITFGEQIYHAMPSIRQWLLEIPNSAAFRAIRIGAALAGLLIGIRMWLGIESEDFSKSA